MNYVLENETQSLPFSIARKNIHSQFGEDGVIEHLMNLAGIKQGYFVEFGAWDGKHLSNCAKLAEEGWQGCFIEGDRTRFLDLKSNYGAEGERIVILNEYVMAEGSSSLSNILKRNKVPSDFSVLSIDIDGNDYYVWESLVDFEPKLCVVEFNPTIPAQVVYVQQKGSDVNFGNSLSALWKLALNKGYELVAVTDLNGFFMPREFCQKMGIPTYTPQQIKSTQYETHLFHGYDGKVSISGFSKLLWHGVGFVSEEMQVLPAALQRFPEGQSAEYYQEMQLFKDGREKKNKVTIR